MENTTRKIPIDAIDDPNIAMRSNVHDDQIEELVADMKAVGLIEPIVVRPKGDRFEIIAGHRRTTAAKILGWAHIEAKIVSATDDQAFTMRAIENLSRHDVNPVDEACFIGELIKNTGKSESEISDLMHRRVEWVRERLEVFEMPDYLQNYIRTKKISLGAALTLNKITDEAQKRYLVNYAGLNGVTVAQAERWRINAEAQASNPNMNIEQIATSQDEAPQAVILVPCARCGQSGRIPDMDYVPVHRFGCEPSQNQ